MREQPLIRCEPPCADAVLDRENRRFAPAFRRFYGKKCRFCRLRAAFGLPFCGLICYNAQRTLLILYFWLLQLIPARGRKRPGRICARGVCDYNSSPRGDGNGEIPALSKSCQNYNSSPRGDGNETLAALMFIERITTHPREGTETFHRALPDRPADHYNSSPRGDGNPTITSW